MTDHTKDTIEQTLLELMQEKYYRDISASALAARAGLSRQGFYLHFKDKDEVLLRYLMKLFRELIDSVRDIRAETVEEMVAVYTRAVRSHADSLILLARNDLGVFLGNAFVRELIQRPPVLPSQREISVTDERRYFNTFYVSAFIAVYTQWLADGMGMPEDELNRILARILTGNYFQS